MATEIKGIALGARLRRGQFFRATWGIDQWWTWATPAPLELDILRSSYDHINSRTDGVVSAASQFEAVTGDKTMVVDLIVQSPGVGLTVAELARRLDDLRISLSLVRLELIDHVIASDPESRGAEQDVAESDRSAQGPFEWFKRQLELLRWVLIAVLVLAIAFVAWKAVETWKR